MNNDNNAEDGMIEKHLKNIKNLGAYAAVRFLLDQQRDIILEDFKKSDFYQKHKFDFPKSIITHCKYPDDLEKWKTSTPVQEPVVEKEQGEMWFEIKEIFMKHYDAHNYPMQAVQELSQQYTITPKAK